MKILIVANYIKNFGGISIVVNNYANKLSKEGFNVEIFNTKRNAIIRLVLILSLLVKVRKFDVIHIHGCSGLGFYPIIIGIISSKLIYSKKTIITFHGGGIESFISKRKNFIVRFFKKADYITVMSSFLHQAFSKILINTVILRNIIDIEIIKESHNNYSQIKLLSIRNISTNYNIPDIIEAYKIIKDTYQNALLKIIGNGELCQTIKKRCIEFPNIEFIGALPNNMIPEMIRDSNIFITVPNQDNQPISILEAWANGTIVISTNVGGVPDMITHKKNGLLVDVNSPQQIANQIFWIVENPEFAKSIIEEGKLEVTKYLWEKTGPLLIDLYTK